LNDTAIALIEIEPATIAGLRYLSCAAFNVILQTRDDATPNPPEPTTMPTTHASSQ
jgi:hypothetical protein